MDINGYIDYLTFGERDCNWYEIIHRERHGYPIGSQLGAGSVCESAINGTNKSANSFGVGAKLDKWHEKRRATISNSGAGSPGSSIHHIGAKMTLELSEQMVAIIGEALAQLPYKIAAPVIAELQRQIDAQGKGRPLDRAAA